jgi:hypothetical protein
MCSKEDFLEDGIHTMNWLNFIIELARRTLRNKAAYPVSVLQVFAV